jgi:pilus assembly protein CpaB
MNPRTLIVVVLAGVCGLSAMVLVQTLRKPAGGPVVPTTPVVYAVDDLKPGETISAAMIEVRQVPIDQVPEDAVRKVEDALDRAAQSQLDKGDMLREKKLAEKGAGRGMAALVRTGMRAFTIQTPSFSGSLAGFLLPGNHVDVLLTMTVSVGRDDESGGSTTTTLLQDVEILAVHTTVNTPTTNKINPDEARSITLLVTPEQASLLDLGQNKGTLHLSLRSQKDTGSTKTKPVSMADLQLPRKRPVVPAPAPAPPTPMPPPVVLEPEPDPEPVEVKLTIRTLRGTSAGADVLTIVQPATGKSRAVRAQPAPPQPPPTSVGNQSRPAAAPPLATGPVG